MRREKQTATTRKEQGALHVGRVEEEEDERKQGGKNLESSTWHSMVRPFLGVATRIISRRVESGAEIRVRVEPRKTQKPLNRFLKDIANFP